MELWNLIRNLWPVEYKVHKKRIDKRLRVDVGKLKECEVGVVRRERPFWREERVDLVHKDPGREITYTPLK